MAGDRRGNSLAHLVTPRIDDGAIIEEREYVFPDQLRRPVEYMSYATSMDHEFLGAFLSKVSQGVSFKLRFQDEAISTYFPRLNSERQGFIDWTWHGDALERFILAFSTPYPGAKTSVQGKEVRIFDAHFLRDQGPQHPFLFGLIVRSFNGRLRVIVNGGQLDIALADTDGMQLARVGDRLHTARALLDEALVSRPVYTPIGLKA
jgi:methionyl-tRNA formyltransferase